MEKVVLTINVIFLLLLIPTFVISLLIGIVSQSPHSKMKNSIVTSSLPYLIFITQIISWIFFANGSYKVAFWIGLIPSINIILIIIGITKDFFKKDKK